MSRLPEPLPQHSQRKNLSAKFGFWCVLRQSRLAEGRRFNRLPLEKVPLQHGVMLSEHRDDYGRIF